MFGEGWLHSSLGNTAIYVKYLMSNIMERAFWSLKPFQGFSLLENAKNNRHNFSCEYDKTRDLC